MDGQIRLSTTDVASNAFGQSWAHTRSYDNRLPTQTDFGNGYNWHVRQWSYLTEDGTTVVLNRTGSQAQWFDLVSGSYVGRFGILDKLRVNMAGKFEWVATNGTVETYEDFSAGAVSGKLLSRAAPAGDVIELSYDGAGHVTSAARTVDLGEGDVTEEFAYAYGTGDHADRISSVVLRRREDEGPWSEVRRATYTYYDDEAADGTLGDLKTVLHEINEPGQGWQETGTYYYRYYVSGETKGFIHGLKYVLEPGAFERAQRAIGDPLLAADAQLASFADYYYEYDDQFRVVKEIAEGGTLTYLLAYYRNPSSATDGANVWRWRTTVIRPDGSTLIAYLNHIGQNMLHDLSSADPAGRWITYWEYDASLYSVTKKASPAAVNMSASPIYDESSNDLSVQLRTGEGLITLYEYYNGTDGPKGYGKFRKIKKGNTGTPVYNQKETQYDTRTAGGVTIYPLVLSRVWSDDAGSLPIDTEYEYDFYADTNRLWQRTTKLPMVSTDQNGSGVDDTFQRMLYDEFGKLIWEQGPKGFIDHFTYDLTTGAQVEYIRDVNKDILPLPEEPEEWERPAGITAPLHLVSNYEIDDLGRRTQTLGPPHPVDGRVVRTAQWVVYLDAARETRTAKGYVTAEGTGENCILVNPVSITRRDADGNTIDQIQAVRGCIDGSGCACTCPSDVAVETSGRLTAGECFSQASWTRWTHRELDHAGRLTASRVYHAIPADGSGHKDSNYGETQYRYDEAGRRNCTVSPGGTITRNVFDALNRSTATWVGTNDWRATDTDPSGGVYPRFDPSSFNPGKFGGLKFWGSGAFGLFKDADGTILAGVGDPVGCWMDRVSGSTLKFTQAINANRPTVGGDPINGGPTVRFNQSGVNAQYMRLSDSLFMANATKEASIFAVFRTKPITGGANQRVLSKESETGEYSLALNRSQDSNDLLATRSNQAGGDHQSADDSAPTGANEVCVTACVWRIAGTYVTMEFYRDGGIVSSQPIDNSNIQGASDNSRGWSLGCEFVDAGFGDTTAVDVAEFLIYDHALAHGDLRELFIWAKNLAVPVQAVNNMVPVTSRAYSADCGCAEPHVLTAHVDNDPVNDRITEYAYDFRNRLVSIAGEEDYFETREYDNLDRLTQVERFNGPPNNPTTPTNRLARSKTYFDDRGNVYKRERYAIGLVDGEPGNHLDENNWYDPAGNLAKQTPMGSFEGRAFTKHQYDGDGRRVASYVGIFTGTLPESYADALTVTSDNKIFEQSIPTYDAASNVIQSTVYQRFHDATGGGVLNLPTGSQPKARVSYVANWPDGIGRTVVSANYGTNDNDSLERPEYAPERSDDVLVVTFTFDAAGNQFETIDPAARIARQAFDDAGQAVLGVTNYVGNPTSTSGACPAGLSTWTTCLTPGNAENVTVRQSFNADGRLVALTACNPSTGNQITRYEYGVTLDDGPIASNDLLRSTIYPDSVDSGDRVTNAYNRQSERMEMTDQNGTHHVYRYDTLGRRTSDDVVATGQNIDETVLRIATSYNPHGLVEKITSYSSLVDDEAVVNEVLRTYNEFDQLVEEYQSHDGAVDTGETPKVQYNYANGSDNTVRQTKLIYPNERELEYSFGASDSDDERLSRVAAIEEDSSAIAEYAYLGVGGIIKTRYVEPDVTCDLTFQGITNDPYFGCLDRFDRIIQIPWTKSASAIAGAAYEYDRSNSRTQMQPLGYTATNALQQYSYDGVNRLTRFIRGAANEMKGQETWSLDATGNWNEYAVTDVDDAEKNLAQSRQANRVNEITDLSRLYGVNWPAPSYDRIGNTVSFPQPLDRAESFTAVYDAWNRLISLTNEGESEPTAIYAYDGVMREITIYDGTDIRHCYYTVSWRNIEERLNSDTTAERHFTWGLRYVDDQIFRDLSSTRLYGLQDANWNLVAVVDIDGVMQQRYRYCAYGDPTALTADGLSTVASDMIHWNHLFVGYRYDNQMGLYHVRRRTLNPALGRWLTNDPLGYGDSTNLIEYCAGSPANLIDPFGLQVGTMPGKTSVGGKEYPSILIAKVDKGPAPESRDLAGTGLDFLGEILPDFTNCLGFACGTPGSLKPPSPPYKGNLSELLKSIGYTCTVDIGAAACKDHCKCDNYVVLYIYIRRGNSFPDVQKKYMDQDPFTEDWVDGGPLDYHALRGAGGGYKYQSHFAPKAELKVEEFTPTEMSPEYFPSSEQVIDKYCCCGK